MLGVKSFVFSEGIALWNAVMLIGVVHFGQVIGFGKGCILVSPDRGLYIFAIKNALITP